MQTMALLPERRNTESLRFNSLADGMGLFLAASQAAGESVRTDTAGALTLVTVHTDATRCGSGHVLPV